MPSSGLIIYHLTLTVVGLNGSVLLLFNSVLANLRNYKKLKQLEKPMRKISDPYSLCLILILMHCLRTYSLRKLHKLRFEQDNKTRKKLFVY